MQSVPNEIPWARNVSPFANVIRFTATTPVTPGLASFPTCMPEPRTITPLIRTMDCIPNAPIKRSTSSDEEDDENEFQPPTKICATADKVASKLGSLSISSSYRTDQTSDCIEELEHDLTEDVDLESGRLVHFSDEMKSVMTVDCSDIVTGMMQQEMEKSSKAVVLWTPNPLTSISPVPIIQSPDSDDSQESQTSDHSGPLIEEIFDDEEMDHEMEVEL